MPRSMPVISGPLPRRPAADIIPWTRLADIPEDAVYVDTENSFVEQKELWDVPILFMMLCALLGRRVGLEEEEGTGMKLSFYLCLAVLLIPVSGLGRFERPHHSGGCRV